MTEKSKGKTSTKVIALVTVIAVVLGLFGGWAIASATSHSDEAGDVWVVQSQTASLSTESLALNNVGASVLQVTADPREANAVSISQLVQDWSDEFGDTMPRAVISGIVDGKNHSLIVNLGTPTATADSITFEGTTVVGGGLAPTELMAATLLIDNEGLIEAKVTEAQG